MDGKTLDLLKSFKKKDASQKSDLIFRSESNNILSITKPRKWLLVIQDEIEKIVKMILKV
ncbi:hypothetical protein ACWOAH_02315 [Vagococcus vulneris]|uniref:Uncharacterized protein n=1 Tax=Vagococcus vulneris TaxID=1977869 RepID=A0A430A145_9ENTE|nr:hypothetical protein [Vagococcus vulneris]RSU00103.1 hypothetical protein CBF37_02040 [Vagococcus vulneris]